MLKDLPDHYDADLVIKLYDLRREAVMRESRRRVFMEFWPASADDVLAAYQPTHPLNASLRQLVGYWEMVFGMARHGIVHTDYLVENSTEGLNLFARFEPYIPVVRERLSPRFLLNTEWVVKNSTLAPEILGRMRSAVQQRLAAKASS
jgi:hypothetical protein